MHALFLLSSLLLAVLVGAAGAGMLRLGPAGDRRSLALAVLAAPLFVLALAGLHAAPWFWASCAPLVGWDRVVSIGIVLVIGLVAAGGLVLNLTRLLLVERLLASCPPIAGNTIAARVSLLSDTLGIDPPALRLLGTDAPVAVTGGLRRPTIVLSRWLVEQLDDRELEAVLGHELAHLARRDPLTHWLGRLLRDATAYLPSSWYARQVLEADAELRADELAVAVTRRPLSMASALGKVWQQSASGPARLSGLPSYGGPSATLLEERLGRLIEGHSRRAPVLPGWLVTGASVLSVGTITPRVLAIGASMLPLACHLRTF